MYLKIFFDAKPLFLCDEIDKVVEPYVHHDDAIFIDELNSHTVKSMIHEMQQPGVHAGVFLHTDLRELKKAFQKKFSLMEAAGGLITNPRGEILMIFRRGKWDLPKGKKEIGESMEACALREVAEETGLHKIEIRSPLLATYHTYHEGTRFILKESHWYRMETTAEEKLVPQLEEDIREIKWIAAADIGVYLPLSFPSVVDVIGAGV